MIVLHVARARTDSINIRGSLGKTRGRALDYQRYFPLFFRMQCPHPFHSLSRFRCVDFPLSLFLSLPFIPVVSRRVAFLSWFSLACSFLCSPFLFSTWYARALYCEFSLPFAHILIFAFSLCLSLLSFPSAIPCSLAEQTETHHSPIPSPLRNVILPAEMETALVLAKPSFRIIH